MFVELAAPSRSRIKRYQQLEAEAEATIQTLNRTLQSKTWRPVVSLTGHHQHRDIWPFYRSADFCMVTSLHDGMNLVAKEFVSVRDDEDGVLILSRFTGAARELRDALLVSPYDLDEMAEAIRAAIEMPSEERRTRMARMRQVVREHNIYRWAGLLLGDLSRIPQEVHSPPRFPDFAQREHAARVHRNPTEDGDARVRAAGSSLPVLFEKPTSGLIPREA